MQFELKYPNYLQSISNFTDQNLQEFSDKMSNGRTEEDTNNLYLSLITSSLYANSNQYVSCHAFRQFVIRYERNHATLQANIKKTNNSLNSKVDILNTKVDSLISKVDILNENVVDLKNLMNKMNRTLTSIQTLLIRFIQLHTQPQSAIRNNNSKISLSSIRSRNSVINNRQSLELRNRAISQTGIQYGMTHSSRAINQNIHNNKRQNTQLHIYNIHSTLPMLNQNQSQIVDRSNPKFTNLRSKENKNVTFKNNFRQGFQVNSKNKLKITLNK